MKTLTKKERRTMQLERHYEFLERFSAYLGNKQDGKKLSLKLLKIEKEAHSYATDWCNGEVDSDLWDQFKERIGAKVLSAFGVKEIPGLFINGDARGYALKIDDAEVRRIERETQTSPDAVQFYRDWGGYGILSPEITGD